MGLALVQWLEKRFLIISVGDGHWHKRLRLTATHTAILKPHFTFTKPL